MAVVPQYKNLEHGHVHGYLEYSFNKYHFLVAFVCTHYLSYAISVDLLHTDYLSVLDGSLSHYYTLSTVRLNERTDQYLLDPSLGYYESCQLKPQSFNKTPPLRSLALPLFQWSTAASSSLPHYYSDPLVHTRCNDLSASKNGSAGKTASQ